MKDDLERKLDDKKYENLSKALDGIFLASEGTEKEEPSRTSFKSMYAAAGISIGAIATMAYFYRKNQQVYSKTVNE